MDKPQRHDGKVMVLKDVVKEYRMSGTVVRALNGVNLQVEKGTLVAIVGPSGSGKTTLLNVIGALHRPTSGDVFIDGVNLNTLDEKALVAHRRAKVGFVFQTFNLIPNLTALENVMLPMEFAGIPAQERVERARRLLEMVGMLQRLKHTPGRMSGGEQQRVAIARALANEPSVVLADEPTGNLDSETGKQIVDLLKELVEGRGKTVIVVTHSQEIQQLAEVTKIIRDGRIVET